MNNDQRINLTWNHFRIIFLAVIVIYVASVYSTLNNFILFSPIRAVLGLIVIFLLPGILVIHIFIGNRLYNDPIAFFCFSILTSISIFLIASIVLNHFFGLDEVTTTILQVFVLFILLSVDFISEMNEPSKNSKIISIPFRLSIFPKKNLIFILILISFLLIYAIGLFFPSLDQGYFQLKVFNEDFSGLPPNSISENGSLQINVQIHNNNYHKINCSLVTKLGNISFQENHSILIEPYNHKNISILILNLEKGEYGIYITLIIDNEEFATLSHRLMVL